jgi:hypothetical protein
MTMRISPRAVRGALVAAFVAALLGSVGCGGGSSGGSGMTLPALSCSDGGPAGLNAVTMNCGGPIDGTTEQVVVTIGGPASGTTTLRGLNFNVTYDPTKLEWVPAASYTSPLFPNALILVVLANQQDPGTIVAALQQVGTDPDVVVTPGQHVVLNLTFKTVAGAAFDPTPLAFENADATSASDPINFTSDLAVGYRP